MNEPSDRRHWLFSQLSEKQQSLFLAIEAKQPHPIQVGLRPSAGPNDPNPTAPACEVREGGGAILVTSFEDVSIAGVAHELLHLKRYIIERQPQIVPKAGGDDHWTITSSIENTIEHTYIIPLEAAYGAKEEGYWEKTFLSNWELLDPER